MEPQACLQGLQRVGLNLRIKPRKRLIREKPEALTVPLEINHVWSMDFMHDQFEDGRTFRLFNVIDDYNREAVGMADRFVKTLKRYYAKLANRRDSKTVMVQLKDWFDDYNLYHPRGALGYLPPTLFSEKRLVT
jgi:transposase InsO family protein